MIFEEEKNRKRIEAKSKLIMESGDACFHINHIYTRLHYKRVWFLILPLYMNFPHLVNADYIFTIHTLRSSLQFVFKLFTTSPFSQY